MDNALVTTNFTEKHMELSQLFLHKVQILMERQDKEITSYQMTDNAWEQNECLKMKLVHDTLELTITLGRRK